MTDIAIRRPDGLRFQSPWIDSFNKLASEVIANVDSALGNGSSYLLAEDQRPQPIKAASVSWKVARASIGSIGTSLERLAAEVFSLATDTDLTGTARARNVNAATDTARARIGAEVTKTKERAAQILAGLRTAAYPARPGTSDAASETAIQGIKNDLTMVLAPLSDTMAILNRLSDQLARAMADRDSLRAWVLASSHWPEDYLVSRGFDSAPDAWAEIAAGTLDRTTPEEGSATRRAYVAVSNPQTGLPVLDVTLGYVLNKVIADVVNQASTFTRR